MGRFKLFLDSQDHLGEVQAPKRGTDRFLEDLSPDITYNPHSSALDKVIILIITTKFIYKISKSLNNQMQITMTSIKFKKKIPKILPLGIENEDRTMKKSWKNQATLSPFNPHPL